MPTKIELEAEVARLTAEREKTWAKFNALATEHGLCEVYDEAVKALGGPPRERDFNLTFGFYIVQSRKLTNEAIDSWGGVSDAAVEYPKSLDQLIKFLQDNRNDLSFNDSEIIEAEEV